MALSEVQKMRKAQVLAVAIRSLRQRLKLRQERLAEMAGTDVGSISRWERGEFSPGPANRRRLAAIARKHHYGDLVAAFDEPLYEWKSALLSARKRHLLALFELALLNHPDKEDFFVPRAARQEHAQLIKALRLVVSRMKRQAAHAGRPLGFEIDGRTLVGRGISMVTDEQVEAWQWETERPRPKTFHQESEGRPGLILQFEDGHIEMYRDSDEYKKVQRQRAREAK